MKHRVVTLLLAAAVCLGVIAAFIPSALAFSDVTGADVAEAVEVLSGAKVEAGLAGAEAPASFQFLRQGYFCVDNKDSAPGHLVFNRSVSLKDSFKF